MPAQAKSVRDPDAVPRVRDPEQSRRDILDAAVAEFAANGLAGARVDAIAARTRTTKRMIYYYFGSKEGLYAAVLEAQYGGMRDAEARLDLDRLAPEAALRRLIETTFDHHAAHPAFVRLVSVENIHEARHLAAFPALRERNAVVIDTLSRLLRRGSDDGVFRDCIDPHDLHFLISSFCFYRVNNRHTLQAIFGVELHEPQRAAAHRRMIVESVLGFVRASSRIVEVANKPRPASRRDAAPPRPVPAGG